MVTCADAVEEAVKHYGGVVSNRKIFDYIKRKYHDDWKDNTIRTHVMGCSVNHSSSHYYRYFRKFLFTVGRGQVRLYDPETDGKWKWTTTGMKKFESDDEGSEDGSSEPEDDNGPDVESNKISLTMEKDLELFLYNDISSLEPGLDLPRDIETRQSSVEGGRIDILAKDSEEAYVVIELKAGKAKDQALAQLLAYMGDIAEKDDSRVRGILVAHSFSDRLIRASKLVPSIKLMKYNIQFSFESI